MDHLRITPAYSVAPQITPEDAQAIADAGFVAVICNRPDEENPPELHAEPVGAALRDAGLAFHLLPVGHGGMTPALIAEQRRIVDEAGGPVLAYCRTGTRCTHVWALGQAGDMPAATILSKAAAAGYDLSGIAHLLDQRIIPG